MFINSFRFMSSSLSNPVDNLSEGLHNGKCIDCTQLIFRCLECKKNYKKTLIKN